MPLVGGRIATVLLQQSDCIRKLPMKSNPVKSLTPHVKYISSIFHSGCMNSNGIAQSETS